ncbi:MAG: hypothetical protein V4640_00090 [Verrucomicrobiota bacterium]
MKQLAALIILLSSLSVACADEFRHVGDFLLQSHFKLTGAKVTPIPMKPIAFRVFTDGVRVRVSAEGDEESHTTFEIYRSDGIGRQRQGSGALEVIPGLQATCNTGGVLRQLRLSRESMTLTTFPGVSDQTIVSHAIAAEPVAPPTAAAQEPTKNP